MSANPAVLEPVGTPVVPSCLNPSRGTGSKASPRGGEDRIGLSAPRLTCSGGLPEGLVSVLPDSARMGKDPGGSH